MQTEQMIHSIGEPTSPKQVSSDKPWYSPRIWWVYIPLGIFAAIVLAFNIFQPITVLPRVGLSPGYSFQNQNAEQITSEDFRGKLTLYSFSYANCEENCPQSLENIASVHDVLQENVPTNVDLALVTISLDPERDTVEKLNTAMSKYAPDDDDADTVPWHFLTGDPLKTKYAVGGGFDLYYNPEEHEVADNYQITFQPRYVLVDGWGIIRSKYGVSVPTTELLLRDINLISEEIENSEGAAKLAYEAAHLFLCYP